ncbi:MAG: HAD family phosphatase [Actinomycetota bacterium]
MGPFDLPDALVFDLDGTIVDTESIEYESIRQVWAGHGADYTITRFEQVIGTSSAANWLYELEALTGRTVNASIAREHYGQVRAQLLSTLSPRPGIETLIKQAAGAGVPLAVASNSTLAWAEARLGDLGLRDFFSALITIDIASHPKPHPHPYLEACAAVDAMPSRSVAFEDSATGTASARAAGLFTIACPVALSAGHDLSAAHRIIDSHIELSLTDLGRAVRP